MRVHGTDALLCVQAHSLTDATCEQAACPWTFVLFVDLDIDSNLPENRDRCRTYPEQSAKRAAENKRSIRFRLQQRPEPDEPDPRHGMLYAMVRANFTDLLNREPSVEHLRSTWSRDWRAGVLSVVNSAFSASSDSGRLQSFVILLVSPPGAGKTTFLTKDVQEQLHRHGRPSYLYDASSDELVEVALTTSLSQRVRDKRSYLIVDEFHMLSGAPCSPVRVGRA